MSALPVPADCATKANPVEPVIGKLIKHWDESPGYSFENAYGTEIRRASLLKQGGKDILITTSSCQVRAQIQKPKNVAPANKPTADNVSEVRVLDTCV